MSFNFNQGHKERQRVAQNILDSYNTLEKSDNSITLDSLEKGGKRAVIGEKRIFGDREYIRTKDGWKYHGKGGGKKAKEHAKHSQKNKESEIKDGRVVGYTNSGKAIYGDKKGNHDDYKDFTYQDHIDARDVYLKDAMKPMFNGDGRPDFGNFHANNHMAGIHEQRAIRIRSKELKE